jgi:hypothetical protein
MRCSAVESDDASKDLCSARSNDVLILMDWLLSNALAFI